VTDELFFPRHFGEFVLVALLGEDGLGTVYRALASSDERRFMRLRILQSAELAPEAVVKAISENALRATSLLHKAIVPRAEMGIVEGVPFIAWYEGAGWTLDLVLARLRAAGILVPTEYALLIAERTAAGLAHAMEEEEPFHHGLLWPGFVSISNDAEVRVGGFGLAQAVLPSLHKPRLLRDIAPYLAPEVRETRRVEDNSDVYSVGVLLLELLTGRRPTLEPPPPQVRAEDRFAAEIGAFLRSSFAEPSQRFTSVVQMRRALQELLAASPYTLSTASFAAFLYKLLNPESSALPATDGESTNPISAEDSSRGSDSAATPDSPGPPLPEERRRRPTRLLLPSTMDTEGPFLRGADPEATGNGEDEQPSLAGQEPLAEPLTGETSWKGEPRSTKRHLAMVTTAVAVSTALGVAGLLLLRTEGRPSPTTSRTALRASSTESLRAPPAASPPSSPEVKHAVEASAVPKLSGKRARQPRAQHQAARLAAVTAQGDPARKSAEDWRLTAALGRVHAERLDAAQLAADAFLDGRSSEREGETLFVQSDWTAAQAAFEQAAALFGQAESLAREERVRRVKLLSANPPQ
jgi:hypothetical protein